MVCYTIGMEDKMLGNPRIPGESLRMGSHHRFGICVMIDG